MQDNNIADTISIEQLFERWHWLSNIVHFLDYLFVLKF